MHDTQDIVRLRKIMRRLTAVVSLVIAISIPLGYFLVSFQNQRDDLYYHAGMTAEYLAKYAYDHGSEWPYANERLGELMNYTQLRPDALFQAVILEDRRTAAQSGAPPGWPYQSHSADVVVNGAAVGVVTASLTLRPLLKHTGLAALFALVLSGSVYFAMHRLPLRVLDDTLDKLQASLKSVEAHATETDYAYEELKRQHRLVEETTQELMKARDQALSADRTKSAFLATMSHELRTPLNAIIGFSEMLTQEVFGSLGSDRYREYCSSIGESGHHLLSVINDVLDISKMEAGKLDLHCEDVDLWSLVDGCCRLVRGKVDESGIVLDVIPPAKPLPIVQADPVKLKQILLNLLSNALKFTPAGRITIELGTLRGKGIYVSVADTGIGMTEADLSIAMLPFQQVDNSHTRSYEGTGLGLPLAKGLIEQHNGSLDIRSKPGEGTVVTVVLPERLKDHAAA